MLPTSYRPKRYSNASPSYPVHHYANAGLNERLRSRSRLTNLAVLLLSGGFCLSLVLNINLWLTGLNPTSGSLTLDDERGERYAFGHRLGRQRGGSGRVDGDGDGNVLIGGSKWGNGTGEEAAFVSPPDSIERTIERTGSVKGLTHLVLVAGHAIWHGSHPENRASDQDWVLTEYQRGGSVRTFYKHIERGVQLMQADPQALLIFSGGQTRSDAPTSTEGQSYLRLAIASGLLPSSSASDAVADADPTSNARGGSSGTEALGRMRATTEEFALDSYENLVFGLVRFREVTGGWPEKITVVGFEMKRARFETLHRAAIKYPKERFHYVGIDDEGDTASSYEGERQYSYLPFTTDPYGCHAPLSTKRTGRNPFARYHPYHASSPPVISRLLEWCPPRVEGKAVGKSVLVESQLFPYSLPWEDGAKESEGSRAKARLSWGRESDR